MANLHRNTHSYFGLDESNYIGSLHQDNTICDNWSEFMILRRIEPLLKLTYDKQLANSKLIKQFHRFEKSLDELFPKERPALLHGDFWSGNYLFDKEGNPAIFDPAVYYGHREMDIAMSKLFGGFETQFYTAYQEEFPLEKGWQSRIDYCNLYPLLVHALLFGESYMSNIRRIMQKF